MALPATDKLNQSGVWLIFEDKTGNLWVSTRETGLYIYDEKTFTAFTQDGKPFKKVHSIIEDKKGNIWFGGADSLWRYDGSTFTKFTKRFIGPIIEDKSGNIWAGSGRDNNLGWELSRYDEDSLSNPKPTVTGIASKPMIFAILEAHDDRRVRLL